MASNDGGADSAPIASRAHDRYFEAIFLHFLANLRFAEDVSQELAALGMGRLHHRILGISAGIPGVTVGELVHILSVTHQNIRVPMKTLIEQGLLLSRVDETDRRVRRLHATARGVDLVGALTQHQTARIHQAFEAAGPEAVEGFLRVHAELLNPADRHFIDRLRRTIDGEEG